MINEYLNTPIIKQYDVVVVGGGFAGISASLAAARQGAKVLLIEREFILGGLGTAGIVTIYLPLCDGMGKQVSYGIAEELFYLSIKYGAEAKYPNAWIDDNNLEQRKKQRLEVQYNPHMFALLAEKLLAENSVDILYGTSVCAVNLIEDKINAVIIENKSGRSAIAVNKSVCDCTGDAVVAKLAGADTVVFEEGNMLAAWYYSVSEKDGYALHMVGQVDDAETFEKGIRVQPLSEKKFSGLTGDDLSTMTQMSHKYMLKDILKHKKQDDTYIPVTIPTIPQVRKTRRIDGVYTMKDTEVHKQFEDSVGIFSDWRKRGPVYELPFRTMYGKNIKNLVCAGRCISVTDDMWEITRVIPVCAVSGQAAGTAATMTDNFNEINISELQQILKLNGVALHLGDTN